MVWLGVYVTNINPTDQRLTAVRPGLGVMQMQRRPIVKELLLIRAIACLSVVLMHSIGMVVRYNSTLPAAAVAWLQSIMALLLFSTPSFAFMSAFLLGYAKRPESELQTLWKRVKYLLFPFLFGAFFYALWQKYMWGLPARARLVYNLYGGYHGYFVLIVLQFYLLNGLFGPFFRRLSPIVVLPIAWVINFTYLLALNLRLVTLPDLGFNWYHLFPAWLFYLALGYYLGLHRDAFLAMLKAAKSSGLVQLGAGLGLLLYLTLSQTLPDLTSQRFDVLIYATGIILLCFSWAGHIRHVPRLLVTVSRYSFGIYLLHWFFIELIWRFSWRFGQVHYLLYTLFLWVASILGSMSVTYLLNLLKIGPFLLGKLGPDIGPVREEASPRRSTT